MEVTSRCIPVILWGDPQSIQPWCLLETLIKDLRSGAVDPLTCDDIILHVAKEDVRNCSPNYYTFDQPGPLGARSSSSDSPCVAF